MSAPIPTHAVKPLTPFGVEVDLDLRGPEHDETVKALFEHYGLLVFRNQQLTQDQQRRVMAKLGPVLEDFRTVGYVSNTRPDGILGDHDVSFHSDFFYTAHPALGISLHAIEAPYEETWTSFADGVGVLDRLPPALRRRIETLEGLNIFSATDEGMRGRQSLDDYPADAPRAMHPLVMVDPVTGRPAMGAIQQNTAVILGLERAESEALLDELHSYTYAPENIYQHRWRTGDLVIWANQAMHHARGGLTPGKTRTLQRVCITDALPSEYDAPIPDSRLPVHMRAQPAGA